MYAMIQRHAPCESAREARALAVSLGALPGFVAYVTLEEQGGAWVSVGLFETQADLADAHQMVADWLAALPQAPLSGLPFATTGEVVVQRGL